MGIGQTFDEVYKEEEEEMDRAKKAIEAEKETELLANTKNGADSEVTANPLSATGNNGGGGDSSPDKTKETNGSFDTEVAALQMAMLMEKLFEKTGNERFDAAFHKLVME